MIDMLPFKPELEITLKARYKDAMKGMRSGMSDSSLREHIFDFHDGLRLIISSQMNGKNRHTHYSARMSIESFDGVEHAVGFMVEHIDLLRDKPMDGSCHVDSSPNSVFHITYDENQSALEKLVPLNNPAWN